MEYKHEIYKVAATTNNSVHQLTVHTFWCLILVLLAGFHKVMEGIEKAIEMGYNPVKVTHLL